MDHKHYTFEEISPELFEALTPFERHIIVDKGTEAPFSGQYNQFKEEGTYYCRRCNEPLYSYDAKFDAHCGWPAFDRMLPFAVESQLDNDGERTEILCATCHAHLGHLFVGEQFTPENQRHCVNSASLHFQEGDPVAAAYFAAGCFWGVEYLFGALKGLQGVTSGYSGGTLANPTYQDLLGGQSGHLETIEVLYNPQAISYEALAKYFFEIHDPTQQDGQGPDIGEQYKSVIFYRNRHQFDTALRLIETLAAKGYAIATELRPAAPFYPAEPYHQNYYRVRKTLPYCHSYTKRF